ncbi:MAG: START domain-containing protein [Saprospiraceae bacterium]
MKVVFLCVLLIILSGFSSKEVEWELKKDKDGIQVYTRKISDATMRAFRGETEVTGSLESIAALFKDVSRYTEWVPGAKLAEVLASSPNSQIFYLQTDAPWPVTDRDGVYQFTFKSSSKSLTILATCLPDYIPIRQDHVRIPKSEGFWEFTAKENGKIKVVYENHSEPGGSIPGWLANATVVNLPFESLKNLKEMLKY